MPRPSPNCPSPSRHFDSIGPTSRCARACVTSRLAFLERAAPGLAGLHGMTSAVRELVTPGTFFEDLGVRYVGPIDGHNIESMEAAFRNAALWDGPIVVHVLTEKGRGYEPATTDTLKMHDYKLRPALSYDEPVPKSFTAAFANSLITLADLDDRVVAITAAMAEPTGLIGFQQRYPTRFFDVGIAEQHAVTAAAGMAMGGLKPVVALYSTFFSRAFDQANLDVGLLNLPVVFVFDRAGHNRRRRAEPPRALGHGPLSRHTEHDGLCSVQCRGDSGNARRGPLDEFARGAAISQDPAPAL